MYKTMYNMQENVHNHTLYTPWIMRNNNFTSDNNDYVKNS